MAKTPVTLLVDGLKDREAQAYDIKDRAENDMDSVVQNDIYQHAESLVMTTGIACHLVASDSHVYIIAAGNIYGEAPTMQFNASGVLELLGAPVISTNQEKRISA